MPWLPDDAMQSQDYLYLESYHSHVQEGTLCSVLYDFDEVHLTAVTASTRATLYMHSNMLSLLA